MQYLTVPYGGAVQVQAVAGGCWWLLVVAGGCWWLLAGAGGCWWLLRVRACYHLCYHYDLSAHFALIRTSNASQGTEIIGFMDDRQARAALAGQLAAGRWGGSATMFLLDTV